MTKVYLFIRKPLGYAICTIVRRSNDNGPLVKGQHRHSTKALVSGL